MSSMIKQCQVLSSIRQKFEGLLQQQKSVGIGLQTFRQKFVFNQNSGPDAIYVDVKTISPSQLLGMAKKQQNICLYMMSEMLFRAGQMLKLPISTTIVALNIAQYYYTRKSLLDLDFRDLSIGAMFLACKSQETLRRSYQIAAVFDYVFKMYEGQRNIKELQLNSLQYNYIKEKVTKTENQILFQLGFQVYKLFDIPHRYISGLLSSFNRHKSCNQIVQYSWNFLNDIYRTKCPIHYPGQVIAASAVFMALQKLSIPLPQKPWWILMEASLNEIKQISFCFHEMLESTQNNEIDINKVSDILQRCGKQSLKVSNAFPVPYYRKIWLQGQGLLMKKIEKPTQPLQKNIDMKQQASQEQNLKEEKDNHKQKSKKQKKKEKKKHKQHKNGKRSRSKSHQKKDNIKGKYQNDDETPKQKNRQIFAVQEKITAEQRHIQNPKIDGQNSQRKNQPTNVVKQVNFVKKSVLLDAKSMLSKFSLQIKKIQEKHESVINVSKVEEAMISKDLEAQVQKQKENINSLTQKIVQNQSGMKEKSQQSSDDQDDELLADLIQIKKKNLQKKEQ